MQARAICHLAAPGEPEPVWWLGFDCAHSGDFLPGLESTLRSMPRLEAYESVLGETYKNVAYVTDECRQLARQLRAVQSPIRLVA